MDRPPPETDAGIGASRVSRSLAYAAAGLALSAGAPAGLLGVRLAFGLAQPAALSEEWTSQGLTYIYVAVSTALVFTAFGAVVGLQADRLLSLAQADKLSGLLNRRGLQARLDRERDLAQRHRQPLSLLWIDVDWLKKINDRFGHRAGDRALQWVASAIRSGCRRTDHAARWGGDEFLVVAPQTDAAAARALAERIRASVDGGPSDERVSVSVGVATWTAEQGPAALGNLLDRADRAVYQAKLGGRNRVAMSEPPAGLSAAVADEPGAPSSPGP